MSNVSPISEVSNDYKIYAGSKFVFRMIETKVLFARIKMSNVASTGNMSNAYEIYVSQALRFCMRKVKISYSDIKRADAAHGDGNRSSLGRVLLGLTASVTDAGKVKLRIWQDHQVKDPVRGSFLRVV